MTDAFYLIGGEPRQTRKKTPKMRFFHPSHPGFSWPPAAPETRSLLFIWKNPGIAV